MKKRIELNRLLAILIAITLVTAIGSCDKEPMNERPELPPLESLVMDFSDFSQLPAGAKGTAETYENFAQAFVTVQFWSWASLATVALPATAYAHALQQDPEYLGDHTWEWSFGLDLQEESYEVVLTGERINNAEFSMEMVIYSTAQPEQGMKWFDGVVRYDHTHAEWNLYGEGGVKMLEAVWNKNYETEAGDLTYTYVEPDQEETGSSIIYSYMPEEVYDASFSISLSDGMTVIEWNTTTLGGRIQDESKYGDTAWHCWESAENGFADTECE